MHPDLYWNTLLVCVCVYTAGSVYTLWWMCVSKTIYTCTSTQLNMYIRMPILWQNPIHEKKKVSSSWTLLLDHKNHIIMADMVNGLTLDIQRIYVYVIWLQIIIVFLVSSSYINLSKIYSYPWTFGRCYINTSVKYASLVTFKHHVQGHISYGTIKLSVTVISSK